MVKGEFCGAFYPEKVKKFSGKKVGCVLGV